MKKLPKFKVVARVFGQTWRLKGGTFSTCAAAFKYRTKMKRLTNFHVLVKQGTRIIKKCPR